MIGGLLLGLGLVVAQGNAPSVNADECAVNYLAVGTLIDAKAGLDPNLDPAIKAQMKSYARTFAERAASVLRLSGPSEIPQSTLTAADALFKPVRAGDKVAHAAMMEHISQCDAAYKLDSIVK